MQDATSLPQDLESCWELIRAQQAVIADHGKALDEAQTEMEKLRKLLSHLVNGHRSEKRILPDAKQAWLPFEDSEEYRQARAEAEAEAERIIETYTVQRRVRKKKKSAPESFPSHIRREEQIVEADSSVKDCPTHGERTVIGYDTTETLVRVPPELYVLVRKYPKYACPGNPACGVSSPERPTSLVAGDRYDTSVAAAIIEAKWFHYLPIYRQQDLFAGSGWTPSRSTLLNIVSQVAFVITPFIEFMTRRVQGDVGIGLDETSCRLLIPKVIPEPIPGDSKSQRLAEKIAEARAKGEDSLMAKMWVYSGLHDAPYHIFDFRVSRHRDGPAEFLHSSRCKVQADCFSGNRSVVLDSDGRLEFVACWSHARRKVVEASTYRAEADQLLGMIQALYDIETRGKDLSWQDRQVLRLRESTVVLAGIKSWMDSAPVRDVLPKSDFADAVRYIRNHWEALNVFVRDGRIPIDNNSVEQLMKQVALGRKAWLFVGSVEAGEQSAMMMTLVSSARRHDLDVGVYIQDVLDQLLAGTTDYEQLLPDVWKRTHPEAVRVYRQEERRDKAERKQYHAAQRRLGRRDLESAK